MDEGKTRGIREKRKKKDCQEENNSVDGWEYQVEEDTEQEGRKEKRNEDNIESEGVKR